MAHAIEPVDEGDATVAYADPTAAGPSDAPSDLVMRDALELSGMIKRREVSCVETMTTYLDHIELHNGTVNAIIALRDREELLDEAKVRDRQLADGHYLGWMHGFPHAVKDLSAVEGLPFTSGSPIFADRVADTDDLFVKRIKSAGAIIVGKTNTPEFGFGSQTYNPVWGTTVSPYDTSRTAGGSSGGAAASLALRMLPVADGTDYMGSLRNPAAFNNVVGFRPSWGRIPESGFIAQGAVSGPMGRSVADVAHLLSTMAGPDANAPLGIDEDPEIFTRSLERNFRGARIAWVGDWDGYLATEPGVLDICESSFETFRQIGCTVESALPDYKPEDIWELFLKWRWWAQLGMVDLYDDPRTRALMKPEMLWEMENAVTLSALDVTKAAAARNSWQTSLTKMFETYDFILAPSAQVFPFDKDTHWPESIAGRPMDTYHRWMETVVPWTMTGVPVAAMPVGFDPRGLPMGVQIIGRHGADRAVLQLAYAYEQATQWVRSVLPPALRTN
ncbi:MAG: amidase [Rhodococcus sp. (in: high G+C Gram-positive bacteria)]